MFLNFQTGYSTGAGQTALLRSDTTGVTRQFFNWICAMKPMKLNLPVNGTTYRSAELYSAENLLKQAIYPHGKEPSTCVNTNQFPAMIPPSSSWATVSTPDQQNLKLTNYVQPPGAAVNALSGFAPMNLGVANYYGMTLPRLQNAAGAFVAPTQESVLAGIRDGHWSSKKIWVPSYSNTKDVSAYALPTVLYAVIPRKGLSSTQADLLKSLVKQILAQTTLGNSLSSPKTPQLRRGGFASMRTQVNASESQLPAGYFPLPSSIAAMAWGEANNEIVSSSVPVGTSVTAASGAMGSTGSMITQATVKQPPTPSSNPTYGPFTLTATQARLLIPLAVGGGALLATIGFVLLAITVLGSRAARRVSIIPAKQEESEGISS